MTDIQKQLSTDVPAEYITQRSGAGGIKLDYVTGRFVKQRLNEIFGWDGWSMEVLDVKLFPDECTAFAHVRLTVQTHINMVGDEMKKVIITRDGLAYGHGRKGAEGFDFAIAESVTDALKRAAVTLGQNLGLSLYPLAKGKKADPAAHSVADQPKRDGQVEMFATMIGKSTTMDELKEVGLEIGEAGLTQPKAEILKTLYATAARKLNAQR